MEALSGDGVGTVEVAEAVEPTGVASVRSPVAGRLSGGGGGATTLRVYTVWISEADRRAAHVLDTGLRRVP